jgi:oxygen-independent coproporphyrinogen-3 oxidase
MRSPVSPAGSDTVKSVYIHAPFCARRCSYCDFAVTVSRRGDLAGWLHALKTELGLVEKEGVFAPGPVLDTLYVGGGTPSILGPKAMEGVRDFLGPSRVGHPELEWTAEANPESFTEAVAEGWARAGVNRLSLGVQSFDGKALDWLNRLHGPEEARMAVRRGRDAGIENISVDLIFGLPPEVDRDWERDLDVALDLQLPHLSLYGLTVEGGTPLHRALQDRSISPPEDEAYRRQFLEANRRLTAAGYRHYEVSNFSLPGFESRHNRVYWGRDAYLGLGNSAHSFRGNRRRWNLRDWPVYLKACLTGGDPWESEEEVSDSATRLETIWLGLRTDRGLPFSFLNSAGRMVVGKWVEEGRAEVEEDRVRLTPKGWLLLDPMVVEMDGTQGG